MPFTTHDGHRIYYEVHGDGPVTVILSHGFILDHEMWTQQVEALSGEYRVVTWDERGHGMTDCHEAFSYWDSAADCMAVLDEVGADRAVLVGMSQGGWLSIRAALEYPQRVAGLVIVDSVTQAYPQEAQQQFIDMANGWCTVGPLGELSDAMVGLQFCAGYDPSVWTAKWRARPPAGWRVPWDTIIHRITSPEETLDERLSEITCPVTIIHGTDDQAFLLEQAYEMAGWFANPVEVTEVAGAGHCPPETHPDEVTAALRAFLAQF